MPEPKTVSHARVLANPGPIWSPGVFYKFGHAVRLLLRCGRLCANLIRVRDKEHRLLASWHPAWIVGRLAIRPDTPEILKMLQDLHHLVGSDQNLATLIGVPKVSIGRWRSGLAVSAPTCRAIWATWARFIHPELTSNAWHWVTWGRFYRPPTPPAEGEKWSDWSI